MPVAWHILKPRDPESKGVLERLHRFMRTNFEPARSFRGPAHFQAELDRWMAKANERGHATLHERPVDRLMVERRRVRALPSPMPPTRRCWRPCAATVAIAASTSRSPSAPWSATTP